MKSDDFFMVNAELNADNANTTQLCQTKKKNPNYHNVNQPSKSTVYLRIFHPDIRGSGKKDSELLSHLHPDFPHVLCLTEHH